ncbi:MAG: enoyl-CoA hydratase/isomerase family protein [Alphaproteobacteria bacterium]|nr:enoyl-CoA hydratase/isomerase family protein [Alphaproteobacteria bacterium]
MNKINYMKSGSVAIIEFNNPPLNTFSYEQRTSVLQGLDLAAADEEVQAVVIIGSDRAFSGGADVTEFTSPKTFYEPHLVSLTQQVEKMPKPVIAAISGVCMGGGLEFALSCHFRIAKSDAIVSLPEVKLGLLPGAGGTQRLPRLVGIETAVNMITSGEPVKAELLKKTQLFEEVVDGDLKEAAIAFAQKLIKEKTPLRRVRDIKVNYPNAEAFFQFARTMVSAVSKNYPAPMKCVEAVEATVNKSFEEGMQLEGTTFLNLMQTPESLALRNLFFGERAAAKIPGIEADVQERPITKVGIIGAGTMGTGIAVNFLNAGYSVTLVEREQPALDKGVMAIGKIYEGAVKKGKSTPEKVEKTMKLLNPSLHMEDLKDMDLVIEAVFEKMEIKQEIFKALDKIVKAGAILASNTSTLDLNAIAAVTSRPQDVVGMHFFSPANVMKLLEVIRGDKTADDVLVTVMSVSKKIKKIAVVSGVCDGFIGNRMIGKYADAARYLLEQGASPYQIDSALEKWGMAMGVFKMSDMAGNDIGWSIRKYQYHFNPSMHKFAIADTLCEMGRFGQKVGLGWYRYEPGNREPLRDPIVDQVITDYRQKNGIKPRKFTDQEIVDYCVYALINEGARILEEGISSKASDIDIVYVYGYGFPPFRGGPMNYANQIGLFSLARQMRKYADEPDADKAFWQPAQLIDTLVNNNKKLV